MTKRMLVDATHPEETRVAIVDSRGDFNRLEDLDFDLASKPLLKGNIYLAKVMRVEPSLQAAFVEYGGNRHGFLSFSEIHPDYFRIPMADRAPDEEEGDNEEDQDSLAELSEAEEAVISPEEQEERSFENRENREEQTTLASESADIEPSATEQTAPVEAAPANVPFTQPASMGETDQDVGLITDFGNAAVIENVPGDMVAMEQTPVESVGGEVTERFVRRQQRPRYKIQEVIKRGQVMLIQVVKEERGNKGAALTTYLSLAGRYCVLMPNTDHGGGVSRKITNHQDRRRMKEILDQLEIPDGMAVILRTAGMEQDPPEIQRDLEYLLRLWSNIREQTLQSTAPSLIYEEANLIKRSMRDLHTSDINEILVAGQKGYERARDFIHAIMPDQVDKIKLYEEPIPLFFRYNVENQIDTLHSPIVQLRSGGYLVINPTEALVSIDVNSGRATRERHIEETAVKTNLEAADEIARQLRLRDLAGLVVIDFIDMEDNRNNNAVERRMKEAMKNDRARLQIGRLSPFGLMELSRQRLRPSLLEINSEKCPHCAGVGFVRSVDSASLSVLRAIEEEGIKQRSSEVTVRVPTRIAMYLLNQKRTALGAIEQRYDMRVQIDNDDTLVSSDYKLERIRTRANTRQNGPAVNTDQVLADAERELPPIVHTNTSENSSTPESGEETDNTQRRGRRRFRDRGNFGRRDRNNHQQAQADVEPTSDTSVEAAPSEFVEGDASTNNDINGDNQQRRGRRRGRRGGRRRGNGEERGNFEGGQRWERRPRHNKDGASFGNNEPTAPIDIPTNVFEIDTTPREHTPASRVYSPQTAAVRTPVTSAHEIVNPPVDRPKGGWWRRFTGQDN